MLDISILLDISFTNIFSQFELSFYSLKNVFWRIEVFHFNEEQFLYQLCFGVIYKKLLLNQGHKDSILYSTSFAVLGFIFRSMIHFFHFLIGS